MDKAKVLFEKKVNEKSNKNCHILSYVILIQNGKKYAAFRFKNMTKGQIKYIEIKTVEQGQSKNDIKHGTYRFKLNEVQKGQAFVPAILTLLHPLTENIEVKITKVVTTNSELLELNEIEKNSYIETNVTKRFSQQDIYKVKPIVPIALSVLLLGLSVLGIFAGINAYKRSHYIFNYKDFEYEFVNPEDSIKKDAPIYITKYNGDDLNVKIESMLLDHKIVGLKGNVFGDNVPQSIIIEDPVLIMSGSFSNLSLNSLSINGECEFENNAIENSTIKSLNINVNNYVHNSKAYKNVNVENLNIESEKDSFSKNDLKGFYNVKNLSVNGSINCTIDELFGFNSTYFLESIKISNQFDIPSSFVEDLSVKSIEIENFSGIINDYAFFDASKLNSIKGLEDATEIGYYAFSNTTNLQGTLDFYNVTSIKDFAFASCGISTLNFSSLKEIGCGCFNNSSVKTLQLLGSYTTIEEGTFEGCAYLSKLSISDDVVEIKNNAFSSCSSLKSITFPSNLKRIGDNSFFNTYILQVDSN